jgi:hypothetical protein
MKFPVSCKLPTVIELGMMVSETNPSEDTGAVGPVVDPPVTVTDTLLETGPLKPCAVAVIVAGPLPSANTSPGAKPPVGQPATPDVQGPTIATLGEEEVQVTPATDPVVNFLALPYVPVTVSCKVEPTAVVFVAGVT